MNINTKTSLVGFLLALSTLNSPATAKTIVEGGKSTTQQSLEQRLNRLNAAIRAREEQLPESSQSQSNQSDFKVANRGWADGRDREWVNARRGGWADGRGRDWVNVNPWRNGWADRGSFNNYNPWRNGGGWVNGRDGGFLNSR